MAYKDEGNYRGAFTKNGEVRYVRGTLQEVLEWLQRVTKGVPDKDYTATVTPVRFLLPWERRRD